MKQLDRYLFSEITRAALNGLVLFLGLVVCVYQLQSFIRLIVRDDWPFDVAFRAFMYSIPQNIGWVLPVAVIFGTITAVGRMSADGELVAMHAGGISFRRMLAPVALVGLVGVAVLFVDTELVAPRAMAAVSRLTWEYGSKAKVVTGFTYTDKEGSQVRSHLFAARLDPGARSLTGVLFTQYDRNRPQVVVVADSATWRGEWLDLRGVQTWRMTPQGPIGATAPEAHYEVGDFPLREEHRPEAMTIPQMRAWIGQLRQVDAPVAQAIRPYEQALAVRRATPWCVLGFALVSAPLGIRRVRASTGVSLGVSLIVFVPYYFVSYTLQVLNKHGGIHPEIPAWTANVLLFIVAAGLIVDRSR